MGVCPAWEGFMTSVGNASMATERSSGLPLIYLASPLTNLSAEMRRCVGCEVRLVKETVEKVTVGDSADGDAWHVAIYAPFERTGPWRNDGLSPNEVYLRNLTEILSSDALIVVADRAASAGVGQETEWAARIGLPILYLSSEGDVSRQILGTPAAITAVGCNGDSEKLAEQVTAFLRRWRLRIQDGPRRRDSRRLRLQPLASRLYERWSGATDKTGIAARCGLDIRMVELALTDPARLAMLPADALIMLSAELAVPLGTPAAQLTISATRSLIRVADEERWPDAAVEGLRLHGIAAVVLDPELDLGTLESWRALYATFRQTP
jgi:hypothetical protein